MLRSKEIQEQMRIKVIDMHQSGKGYNAKAVGLQKNHGKPWFYQIVKTLVNPPGVAGPPKVNLEHS